MNEVNAGHPPHIAMGIRAASQTAQLEKLLETDVALLSAGRLVQQDNAVPPLGKNLFFIESVSSSLKLTKVIDIVDRQKTTADKAAKAEPAHHHQK
jgi:hypothetical protein